MTTQRPEFQSVSTHFLKSIYLKDIFFKNHFPSKDFFVRCACLSVCACVCCTCQYAFFFSGCVCFSTGACVPLTKCHTVTLSLTCDIMNVRHFVPKLRRSMALVVYGNRDRPKRTLSLRECALPEVLLVGNCRQKSGDCRTTRCSGSDRCANMEGFYHRCIKVGTIGQ